MLHKSGCPHIVSAISSYLQPEDLASCMCTNRTWRMSIQDNNDLLKSVKQYQVKKRENIENLYNQASRSNHHAPLTGLTNFTSPSSRPFPILDEPYTSHTSYFFKEDNRSLMCSNCGSIICSGCLQMTNTTDFSRSLGSRKRSWCSENIAGMKRSKRRLKRL